MARADSLPILLQLLWPEGTYRCLNCLHCPHHRELGGCLLPTRTLPYKTPKTIIQKMRRFAATPDPRHKFQDRLNSLSDKQLVEIYQLLESGTAIKHIEQIIRQDWHELENCGQIWRQISWVLQQMLRDGKEGVQAVSKRVGDLRREEIALRDKVTNFETEIVKRFNPLDELARLAGIQRKRIEQFTELERVRLELDGMDDDCKPKVNREIDSMIEKQRLLVQEFIRSLRELRDLTGEGIARDKTPKALHQTHIHLQQTISAPNEMATVIETYAQDLDELAIPLSEVKQLIQATDDSSR